MPESVNKFAGIIRYGRFGAFTKGVTIRMPHDTIRIENFGCDTILFYTIHICTVKSYRLVIKLYMSLRAAILRVQY